MKYLKLYGLQRSGTNYIKFLIEQNFDCFVLQNWFGWKHGKVVFLKEDEQHVRDLSCCDLTPEQKKSIKFAEVPRIAIQKDVYSWLVSYHKYRKFKWDHFRKFVDIYYEHNAHYKKNCFMIDYDLLIVAPDAVMACLMLHFKLERRDVEWVYECNKTMPRGGDDHSDSWAMKYDNNPFKVDYYKNKEYLGEIPNIDRVTEYIKSNHGHQN